MSFLTLLTSAFTVANTYILAHNGFYGKAFYVYNEPHPPIIEHHRYYYTLTILDNNQTHLPPKEVQYYVRPIELIKAQKL